MPDYLNGDPIAELNATVRANGPSIQPASALKHRPFQFDFPAWLAKHGAEQTRPPLDKVITALKEKGVTVFGATGYCFGARYVFDLSFDKVIKAAVVSHPSLLNVPEDLEKFKASGVPLLINSCEVSSLLHFQRMSF